tara:strand:+ start:2912 stop:3331 length:420 start_codon:yes stop_codon:yes gene_type:complete
MKKKQKVLTTNLKIISVPNGNVLKFIDKKSKTFNGFGEIYFSLVKKSKIKAWKKHSRMTMNLTVPIGKVKFVFFDEEKNFLKEIILGEKDYKLITVKPGVWFGFKGLANNISLVSNLSNIIHKKDETTNLNTNSIRYKW